MKTIIVVLTVIALLVLTTATAFAYGDGAYGDGGQGICTEQCSGDGTGQMHRWQHKVQWAEPATGAGRGSVYQHQWGECNGD